ncbi:MAG: fused MFS/spermidine synthase [Chloroflexi bacterium]|nr:fused MFS/spermidine synthase [Chloroflexota bacterium]
MAGSCWKTFSKRRGERVCYEVVATRYDAQTPYQHVEIVDTVSYGLALFLDDKIQSAQADEFIYHEALVHPAMVAHPEPRHVFIAGGGEGATLREVLRHASVERVVMVDIDRDAVAACREHLRPVHGGSFDDPRVWLLHDDARLALERAPDLQSLRYDVIIVDVTDPLAGGPAYRLFTHEFYQIVRARLQPDGILAVQAESGDPGVLRGHLSICQTIGGVFTHTRGYCAHIPSFGESWGFVVASDAIDIARCEVTAVDAVLRQRSCWPLRYYDGLTHQALFTPDRGYREQARVAHSVITDAQPLIVE